MSDRIKNIGGHWQQKGTHAFHLEKARKTLFSKLILLINNNRANTSYSKFQIHLGGRFPLEEYEEYVAVLSHFHPFYLANQFSESSRHRNVSSSGQL
jgi:hypothetical protein